MLVSATTQGTLRGTLARWLETGVLSGPWSRAIASSYGMLAARAVPRRLLVPSGIHAVTVGGATLGGSGKTRVALAAAALLASRGANVVLIGHGYRARRPAARVVLPTDWLADVGDEALVCARAFAPGACSARVVIGPSRQSAVDFASLLLPRPDVLVIDGPLQLVPRRSSLSILALDAAHPWGAGQLPPAGDLRAPRAALLAHADHMVFVEALPSSLVHAGRAFDVASFRREFATARVGLFTALARPGRLALALRAAGIAPHAVVAAPDHGPMTAALARRMTAAGVDLWLATAKCAVHLEAVALAAPIAVLQGSVALSARVTESIADLLTSPHTPRLDPSRRKALVSGEARGLA